MEQNTELSDENPPLEVAHKFNRAQRRAAKFERGVSAGSSVSGRYPGKAIKRTGQPAWFREMQRQSAIKRELKKIKVWQLVQHLPAELVRHLNDHFETVWDLSQASQRKVLAVPTVGPAAARKVHQYLTERGVPVVWTAP